MTTTLFAGWGSPAMNYILKKAHAEGRTPLTEEGAIQELVDYLEDWCKANVKNGWSQDEYKIWFMIDDPKEALLFKLTHCGSQ